MHLRSYHDFKKYIVEFLTDIEELVEEIIEEEYNNYHRNKHNLDLIFVVNSIKDRHKHHKNVLKPATHLKQQRIVTIKKSKKRRGTHMSTEVYKLSWNKSVSVNAVSQDLTIVVNGIPFGHPGLDMTTESFVEAFETDASVEWFVTTHGENGAVADSVHATFVAVNEAPSVEPATGLTQAFLAHNG